MRLVLLTAMLAACQSPSTASPDGGSGAASLELFILPLGAPGGVALDLASVSFDEIRLISDSGEDLAAPTSVDLLGPETLVGVADAAPGLYSRVRLRLGPEDHETLRIEGTRGGDHLVLNARGDDEIDLRAPVGARLDPGQRLRIEVEVDRSRWFSGVDLGSAEVEDGQLLLDPESDSNSELAEQAVESILGSFSIAGTAVVDEALGEDDGHGGGGDDDGGGP